MRTMQADPSNVRAATRAATCYLKMGQLTEAAHVLDVVTATVTASGKLMPPELVSKQNDLQVTKRLVSEVRSHAFLPVWSVHTSLNAYQFPLRHNVCHIPMQPVANKPCSQGSLVNGLHFVPLA